MIQILQVYVNWWSKFLDSYKEQVRAVIISTKKRSLGVVGERDFKSICGKKKNNFWTTNTVKWRKINRWLLTSVHCLYWVINDSFMWSSVDKTSHIVDLRYYSLNERPLHIKIHILCIDQQKKCDSDTVCCKCGKKGLWNNWHLRPQLMGSQSVLCLFFLLSCFVVFVPWLPSAAFMNVWGLHAYKKLNNTEVEIELLLLYLKQLQCS